MLVSSLVAHNRFMAWMPVRAGRDHLEQYAKMSVLDAVAELVWNGLDAEADEVDVEIQTGTMGLDSLRYVTRIVVVDNGHGITHERALTDFQSLGDSWKKTLNGRTLNGKRALHGSQGRGRFYVYSLGHHARWSSVALENGQNFRVDIVGDQSKIDGFVIDDPEPTSVPTGTRVTVSVEQGRSLTALLRDDLHIQLAARLAGHLLANDDVVVRLNGTALDPQRLVEGEPVRIQLEAVSTDQSDGHETPILMIVDWTEEMRRAPGIMLCNESGMALIDLDGPTSGTAVKSTGYLLWSGFSRSRLDRAIALMQYADIITEASKVFDQHVKARLGEVTATIVTRLKREGAYPYQTDIPTDPIKRTEREMFDLVAVTVRGTLNSGGKQQRAMSARLLKLALEERPESLDRILAETLDLSVDDRAQLADMLRHSTLVRSLERLRR